METAKFSKLAQDADENDRGGIDEPDDLDGKAEEPDGGAHEEEERLGQPNEGVQE